MISIYWLPVLAVLPVLACLLLKALRGVPKLTILEVPSFLRRIDSHEYMKELNPLMDEVLRSTFSRREFRKSQRQRLYRMREIVACMAHDAFIFIRLASTSLWLETKERPGMEDSEKYVALATELQSAAVEFRVYTLFALLRINFWLILRTQGWSPLPSPKIPDLSSIAGFTFHASYLRFKDAAAALCMQYGQEFHDEIVPLI